MASLAVPVGSCRRNPVFTIGHSNRSVTELIALLGEAGADLVADVRAFPRSRANPQFNGPALQEELHGAAMAYRYLPALGGRRHGRKADSPNTLWRNGSFRAYADYAGTTEFRAGLARLCALAGEHRCAVMCAEAVWWRCHRRIIADYLLAAGFKVVHILGSGKLTPATLTPGAQPGAGGGLVYPPSTSLEPGLAGERRRL
ncbi:MAG: DUF488 domain-containing protein [Gammaproteobacteria bacterium]|nr:DUF488 domain-containing protein [Gammaproteobacteria bacterium]